MGKRERDKERLMERVRQSHTEAVDQARELRIARAHAHEVNHCVAEPFGCGRLITPLIIQDAANLLVLMETDAGPDGPMQEALAFRDQQSLREYHESVMCQQCQDKFFAVGESEGPETGGLVELTETQVRAL